MKVPIEAADISEDDAQRFAERLDHLWPSVERQGPLGLAVSGGPDSVALLLLAQAAMPGQIAAACVDHGLRPEAAQEVALVEQLCTALNVPFTAIKVSVPRGNLQAKARQARYQALERWAVETKLGAIATAHHADDQAETLLMRLVRGSGLSGLAGVRPWSHFGENETVLLRPLLDWRKAELEVLVAEAGIVPARDPSNTSLAFDRVRMRAHLAEHETTLPPDALALSAEHLAEAWRAIEWYAAVDWEEMVCREDGDARAILYYANVPRIIAIETIMRAIAELGGMTTRGEAGRAYDRLWRGHNASLSGVLVTPSIEKVESMGADMRVWRFTNEPPRTSH